jgi:transcription initiation factor TFIIB
MIQDVTLTVDEDADGSESILGSRAVKKELHKQDTKSDSFTCSDCGSEKTIRIVRTGETVCAKCGLVVAERRIDQRQEWRAFTADERNSRARAGSPIKYTSHDKGLSTVIDWRNRDSSGRKFSSEKRAEISRLRKWQIRSRVHSSADRNLSQAMSEIERLSSQLGLKRSVNELAAMLYRKLIVKKLLRSRSIDALAAASIYAALRLRQIPRSLKEIGHHTHVDWKAIGRYYRLLVQKLKLRLPVPDPMNYVPKLITKLELPGTMQEVALDVIRDAKNHGRLLTGRDPRGIAAGALYITSILTDNRVTQREIAAAAGVTEVTVRNRYKELVRELNIEVA